MYPFDDEEERDFYSRDYSSPRRKSTAFDPFGDIDTDITGVTKKFGADGKFIENEDANRRKRLFSAEPQATKTETELAPMVESSEYADDYSWWRKETGYRDWLKGQNLDPDKLDSFTGNKLFTEYIKFKAENPEGFMKFSSDVMGAVGGVIQGVSDTLSKIPGIKTIAKPVGSILQFIGNLADLPRNVLAGAFTALSTDNPDEILPNMWEALKFSVGEVVGNEGTGKDVGRYFSWMDGQLMNMVEKAKQGMSEKEYKEYIDSDSFRQTKRLWQTGGMLLDLVADPAWFIGAGSSKALKSMRTLGHGKEFIGNLVNNISDLSKGGFATAVEKTKAFETAAESINKFTTESKKLVDFIKADKSFLKTLGMEAFDFSKVGLTETVDVLVNKFGALAKGDLKGFEYSMRLKIPFVNRSLGGMKIGPAMPGMANLSEKIIGKMSGQPSSVLSIAGRSPERAATKVNVLSDYPRAIHHAQELFNGALDDMKKSADAGIRTEALRIMKDPDAYNDMVSAIRESNTTSAIFDFLEIPGAGEATKRSLFAVNEPLFKELLTQPAIEKMRKELDDVFKNSFDKKKRSVEYNLQLARMHGMEDELGRSVGLDETELQELFIKDMKKTPKEKLNFNEAVSKFREEAKDMLRLGDEAGKPYTDIANKIESQGTKYYPHELTDEAKKYITDFKKKKGIPEQPIKIGQLMPDPTRKIYTASDFHDTTLQDLVFGPNKAIEFRKILEETPNKGILMMHTGLRELFINDPDTFKKLTQWSNILDSKGVPIKMNDLSTISNVGKDIHPLITQGSASLLNEYSKRGLLFEGFQGRFYKGGFEPIYNKVLKDQQVIERLESSNYVLAEMQKSGLMKKLKNESDLINYDKTWKYQDAGIFKGFIIKDYLEKPLENAVKGMLGIAEHVDDTSPWFVKKGKELLDGFASWWKVNIFIKNPGAQPRNFISNRVVMWGLGISPGNIFSKEAYQGRKVWKYYRAAEKYQESIFTGKKTTQLKARMIQLGKDTVSYEGKNISIMEATERLMQNNVLGTGFVKDMAREMHGADDLDEYERFQKTAARSEQSIIRQWNPMLYFIGKNDKYAETFKNFGSTIENAYGRLETFFTLTEKKGMTAIEAAQMTNETLIDYGRISKTENALRRYLIPFYCVPDNTEILTKKGWKFYNEISIGDSVLTYNLGIDRSEWEPIKDIAIFNYDGDLLSIGNSYHRFMFTKDHRVPVVKDRSWFRRIVRVYELKDGDRIPLAADMDIQTSSILTPRDAALLAWIVTDGYFRWRKNSFESMIYQSPNKHAIKIRKMFGTYISSESIHPDTGVICFRLKAEFTKRITKYFKSKNDLPGIVTRLNKQALEGMFEAMMDAEGCRNNSNSKYDRGMGDSFSQKLGPVMDSFQIICLLLGKAFQIGYSEKYDRACGYVKKSRYHFYHKKHNKMIPYIGKIWCPKTENSTWYMRQNGKVMITGNTWQSRMVPLMLQKALEQPAFFSKITQLKNNAYSILELDKNFAPRGEEVMEGIPSISLDPKNVGKFFKGKPMNEIKTQYFSGEGWLPQAVVNLFEPSKLKNLIAPDSIEEWAPLETAVNIGKGAMEYVVGGMNPLLKVPVESLTGYSFQNKRMLQTYPDQTTEFLGMHMAPKRVNILRSVFGTLREVDDVISVFEKNAITGQPKYTVYDLAYKNLLGYRPYNRNEIREVTGALGELKQIYQSNLSDARKMVHDQPQAQKHARNALMAYHGIKALEWYKDFLTEVRDKEATARGIQLDIADIEERLANPRLNRKQVQKYEEKKMSLYERLEAFIADQEEL